MDQVYYIGFIVLIAVTINQVIELYMVDKSPAKDREKLLDERKKHKQFIHDHLSGLHKSNIQIYSELHAIKHNMDELYKAYKPKFSATDELLTENLIKELGTIKPMKVKKLAKSKGKKRK